jgi:hypothetical protein
MDKNFYIVKETPWVANPEIFKRIAELIERPFNLYILGEDPGSQVAYGKVTNSQKIGNQLKWEKNYSASALLKYEELSSLGPPSNFQRK